MERVALGCAEAEILGQQPAAEERRTGERDLRRMAGRDVVERGGKGAHRSEHNGRPARVVALERLIERAAAID
jgi:hypothetical protein